MAAALHVTKLTAAKRQIQAAIRLFFLREDELAVHTVASAAYGLLTDLKKKRGLDEAEDTYRTMYFYLVRDFRRGTLPTDLTSDPERVAAIRRIADQLSFITADSRLADFQVSMSLDQVRHYWNKHNQAANFLKHADRDTHRALPLKKINNFLLLLKCCSAYQDIAPDDLGNEGLIFEAFMAAKNPTHSAASSSFDSLVELIGSVPNDHRLDVCYETIVKMNTTSSA